MVVFGVGMLVSLCVAAAVLYAVAVPCLREGAPVLIPHGERLARHARHRARLARRRTRVRLRAVVEHEGLAVQERISR